MAAKDHIRIEQFLNDLEQHADSEGVVQGTPAKKAMRAMNIRPISRVDSPGETWGTSYQRLQINKDGSLKKDELGTGERLYTNQQHLHVPTLRKYAQNPHSWEDTPAEDRHTESPFLPESDDDEYRPFVYEDGADGRQWVEEGHHRIMAARLNGMGLRVRRGEKL